ncbi:32285_t:CDS:2 [Gigaspora margarita]|uniref:32285_t:CDS:1 n=1 Tax=Gigaspora margarita TaxID=4874 RepID=A0ABN7UTU1_GIGMA|nr:32285_t:CDS:2 [Gigaspora margarita]
MEHANLINIISKVISTFYKYNLMLDIGVDSNLSTNKTLSKEKHGLAVLHNNSSLLEIPEVVRQARNCSEFSKQDQINIGKI